MSMTLKEKVDHIQRSNGMLCIGLDTTVDKLPIGFSRTPQGMVSFNREIVEATKDLCCSYKINFAFYEQYGHEGMRALEQTVALLPDSHIRIADAKRGDIGNTAEAYARSVFELMPFDSVTVSPYMGHDSVLPFLSYADKLVFILALTSNPGSREFQRLPTDEGLLYEVVMKSAMRWEGPADRGFVIGATHPQELESIRRHYPHVPLLIPGVGAQGADPAALRAANGNGPAFINSSRAILYASQDTDFAERARAVAQLTANALR